MNVDNALKSIKDYESKMPYNEESIRKIINILSARHVLYKVVKCVSQESCSLNELAATTSDERGIYAAIELLNNPEKYGISKSDSIEEIFDNYIHVYKGIFRKYDSIGYGGTFDLLHNGHKYIISYAMNVAETVYIGILSDNLAKKKSPNIRPLFERKQNLKKYLSKFDGNFFISVIDSPYDIASTSRSLEAIIATEDTVETVQKINKIRESNGLPKLKVEFVEYVTAEDGGRISSTRIRRGEIDASGRIIKE